MPPGGNGQLATPELCDGLQSPTAILLLSAVTKRF
jgi:hypothetical protein